MKRNNCRGGRKILLLLGKSCSGKTTIQKELVKLGLSSIVAYTTRPKRENEVNGVTYNFTPESNFKLLESNGFFAETTSYKVANGDTWYYGTAMEDLSDRKVIITNPKGLKELNRSTNVHPISFYINTDEDVIWDRLLRRKDNIDEAQRRIIADRQDFDGIEQNVDFVFRNNGELEPRILADMIKYTYDKYMDPFH